MKFLPLFAILFALFPLTDTDIWWHLACSREWVTTWTPVRGPVVNVHEYFQQIVGAVYSIGGAPLLVVFKAVLWGMVFALFLWPSHLRKKNMGDVRWAPVAFLLCTFVLFLFRFQMEIRPVVFSLLFLGVYWNVLPWLFGRFSDSGGTVRELLKTWGVTVLLFALQWLWCKFQGLYILGPLFALLCAGHAIWIARKNVPVKNGRKVLLLVALFVVLLFAMPFLHSEGLALFLYPFGLLDRLLGITPSAAVFASEIAENRSPFTLLLAGENILQSCVMVFLSLAGVAIAVLKLVRDRKDIVLYTTLLVTSVMALVAERNFVLFLPVLMFFIPHFSFHIPHPTSHIKLSLLISIALLGFWARSASVYDSWVAYQRVPVGAAEWMKAHPHVGRLFNDDRAGGYLAFVNPEDSVYIDGRFILKTADFFERYLHYAADPGLFLSDADSLGVDRAIFPLRYYARWGKLLGVLDRNSRWEKCYADGYYIVFCKK